MITMPDGDWYLDDLAGDTIGPFRDDGSFAYREVPPILQSRFEQGTSFAGQSAVTHSKREISAQLDGWNNPRDYPLAPASRKRWMVYLTTASGHESPTASFNKGQPGSAHWVESGETQGTKHIGYGNTYETRFYDSYDSYGSVWYSGFRYEIGPMIIEPNGYTAYADVTLTQMYPMEPKQRLFKPSTPIPGPALLSAPIEVRTFPSTKKRRRFARRLGLRSVHVDTHHIQKVVSDLLDTTPLPELSLRSYGELSQQAVGKLKKVDSNLLEALVELKSLKGLSRQLIALPKSFGLKKTSGDYLAVKWAALPIVNDLTQIIGSFSKMGPTLNSMGVIQLTGTDKSSKSETWGAVTVSRTVTRRAHLYVYPDRKLNSLTRFLRDHGLYPSAKNLWDIVPFSFLVDWFVNVGRFLDTMDANSQFAELSIPVCVYSEKSRTTYTLEIKGVGMITAVDTAYNRFWTKSPIAPQYNFRDNQVTAHKRWLEGSALILQIKRK